MVFYLLSVNIGSCQNYELKIDAADSKNTYIVESLFYKKKHTNKTELNNEINNFSEKLVLKGFINNNYSIVENSHTYICTFKLNKQFKRIKIFFEKSDLENRLLKQLSKKHGNNYFEIPIENVENSLNKIKDNLIKKGYSFSKVSLENLQVKNNIIIADLTIKNTHKRTIDKVVIKGYTDFPQKYISNELNLKKNNLFNKENLNSIEKQLNSISFIEQLKKPEVLFTKDSTILYLYLKKLKRNQFDGLIGFATDETTNNLKINGYINLLLNNTFNNGESFNLIWKNSGNDRTSLNLNFINPYIFKSKFTFKGLLNIQKNDSTFINRNTELGISYSLSKNQTFGGIANFTSSNTLTKTAIDNYEDYSKNLIGFSYHIKKLINNTNSFSLDFNYLIGKRANYLNKIKQTKLELNTHFLKSINPKNRLYLKNTTEILNSDNIYQNELFQIGGINSIRGFNEQSILTSSYNISSIEFQYLLTDSNFFYTVTDIGFIKNNLLTELKNLLGIGLGYNFRQKNTNINLSYVIGKSNLDSFKINNAKLHIKLTYLF